MSLTWKHIELLYTWCLNIHLSFVNFAAIPVKKETRNKILQQWNLLWCATFELSCINYMICGAYRCVLFSTTRATLVCFLYSTYFNHCLLLILILEQCVWKKFPRYLWKHSYMHCEKIFSRKGDILVEYCLPFFFKHCLYAQYESFGLTCVWWH